MVAMNQLQQWQDIRWQRLIRTETGSQYTTYRLQPNSWSSAWPARRCACTHNNHRHSRTACIHAASCAWLNKATQTKFSQVIFHFNFHKTTSMKYNQWQEMQRPQAGSIVHSNWCTQILHTLTHRAGCSVRLLDAKFPNIWHAHIKNVHRISNSDCFYGPTETVSITDSQLTSAFKD